MSTMSPQDEMSVYDVAALTLGELANLINDIRGEFEQAEARLASQGEQIAQLTQERDEAQANFQYVLDKAADNNLQHYRELGATCAEALNAADDLRNELAAALTARDEAERRNQWQPIETMPRDGSAFWAYSPEFIDADFNPTGVIEACFDGERFIGAVWNGQSDIWNTLPVEPTQWRRFPDPPSDPSADPPKEQA